MKKLIKNVTAVMIAILMVFGSAPLLGLAGLTEQPQGMSLTANAVQTPQIGDIREFGSFPQTQVTDSLTLLALNALSLDWVYYNYSSGTGSEGSQTQSDYMKYADVTYDGNRYRAVTFVSYRPRYTYGIPSDVKSYQDDNGYSVNNVYWFKYEPLKWRVLDPTTGLVMAEDIIDSREFNFTAPYPTWENSDVRTWLNQTFYNTAFTDTEKSSIGETTLSTPGYNGSDGGADTTDKLFLLSREEVTDTACGFSESLLVCDKVRMAQGSDYAKCQGLSVNASQDYYGNSSWWLRSNCGDADAASYVYSGGLVTSMDVDYTAVGIRPAFKTTNLSSLVCRVTNVNLLKEKLFLMAGNTSLLSVLVEPAGATDKSITWYSDNTDVATVDEYGLVTAVAQGITTVTVTTNDGGYTDVCEVTVFEDIVSWQTGDVGTFGNYPQTLVTDDETLAGLDALTNNWVSYRYYSGTGGWNTQTQNDYMQYADLTFRGETYRAVKFTSYRPYITYYTSSDSNSSQDENGYVTDTVYWFKYEPIKWRVLDTSTGLLMAEDVIDSGELHNTTPYPTWANSDIRAWLNETFCNTAFSAAEQSRIVDSAVSTPSYNGNSGGADTTDKLFLLSRDEVTTAAYGFNTGGMVFDPVRMGRGSDYAKCQGLLVGVSAEDFGYSGWRLRSPGYDTGDAGYVNGGGDLYAGFNVSYTDIGVRPVMKISDLSCLNYFYSAYEQLTDIVLSSNTLSIVEGTTAQLVVTAVPSSALFGPVTWSSNNPDAATVNEGGLVTAVVPGTATITVTTNDGRFTDTCEVTITHAAVSAIEVKTRPSKIKYYIGETLNTSGLALTVLYDNGTTQTVIRGFTCTPTIFNEIGTQTITVAYGEKTCSFDVNVNRIGTSDCDVEVIPNQTYTGSSIMPTVTVTYGGTTLTRDTDYSVTYSNNVNFGTATATITGMGNYSGTKTTTFKINPTDASLFSVEPIPNQICTGSMITPSVIVKFSGEMLTLNTDYNVSYSDNVTMGTATVTITGRGNFKGTKTVTFSIVSSDIAIMGITLSTEILEMQYGGYGRLYVEFNPVDATNKAVTWTSSNPDVATVDLSGNLNAKGSGTAIITATAEDGDHTASCTVTVKTAWWQWIIKIILFGWFWY